MFFFVVGRICGIFFLPNCDTEWMTHVLAGIPPELLSPEEKAGLLEDIQRGLQNSQLIVDALDRLEGACEVLRRAEEA